MSRTQAQADAAITHDPPQADGIIIVRDTYWSGTYDRDAQVFLYCAVCTLKENLRNLNDGELVRAWMNYKQVSRQAAVGISLRAVGNYISGMIDNKWMADGGWWHYVTNDGAKPETEAKVIDALNGVPQRGPR